MLKKLAISATIGLILIGTTACNTVRGVGQDLESVANDVDEAV